MVASAGQVLNSCLVFDEQGEQVRDKIICSAGVGQRRYGEAKTIRPGNQVVVVDSRSGASGWRSTTCASRTVRAVKRWTSSCCLPSRDHRQMHWEVLVRAGSRTYPM
jgi:hypothetical protein